MFKPLISFTSGYALPYIAEFAIVRVRVTLRLTVSRTVCLGVGPPLWTFNQILLLFTFSGLKCIVLSLWGALSDERPSLSFVSHSLVIFLLASRV
jgi:hypothetical protein